MSTASKSITQWASDTGEFKRGPSQFRNHISSQSGAEFPPEKGRYHLYVSYACPWAHRTLIVRKLKGLEDIIPYTAVHWEMLEKGWRFATSDEKIPGDNVTPDPIHPDFTHLRDLYFDVSPDYEGRFTVPTLYDVKQNKIVSNESSEIIRMFYTEFDDIIPDEYKKIDLFPKSLQLEIEATNDWTYNDINNGVYKSGFATSQSAYETAVHPLFNSLDRVEEHLSKNANPYYFGEHMTEADVRLYTTIVRFDPVYVQHFKCNVRDIRSGYPAIHQWLRNLYWNVPAFGETTQFEHIKKHYTKSHKQINPYHITPVGPVPDILPLNQVVPAAAAAVRSTNQ
ncbi:MAG: S-glutathionyl-(chloro)hydroquinone reductase [Heterodermia speciosa]|uniref:Glutathione S-transferase omega-like 2 n=1 Tax=Heterodermia speciosa TaxID=116794 RepID=A0A8H3IDF7_9LECA|nr:MAG: S-glutathionyl-(chloro)hydroquinone reductase [Heterodermia speciosa]